VDIEYTTVYQAGPTTVLDLLTDLDFLRDFAGELGVSSHQAIVSKIGEARSVALRIVASTDVCPAVFRSFMGPVITIADLRLWEPDGAGGYHSRWSAEATAKGRTAAIAGALTLTPNGATSRFTARADVRVKIAFIGGLAKGEIAALGGGSLGDQTTVMNRWLARMGTAA